MTTQSHRNRLGCRERPHDTTRWGFPVVITSVDVEYRATHSGKVPERKEDIIAVVVATGTRARQRADLNASARCSTRVDREGL